MSRLKNRNKYIPNGFKFYDASLRWTSPPNASFQVICDGLRTARMANPGLSAARGLSTDPNVIAEEVDAFNSAICESHGWSDFITGSAGGAAQVPFPQPQHRPALNVVRNAAVGSSILIEWISSGAEAVPQEQANRRAEICSRCPLNKKGDWTSWFTGPVSSAIKAALGKKNDFKLSTPFDEQLGVCEACSCPMSLKVFVPFDKFYPKMTQPAKDALDKNCWIKSEAAK
jgi:hypothetical protein